jgi:hypothetical protein
MLCLRKINAACIALLINPTLCCEYYVSTISGTGNTGHRDGNATQALYNFPTSVTIDSTGNLFVADKDNHEIRKITPDGLVSSFAGSGLIGSND